MPPQHLITTTEELETFCRAHKDAPFITVDTEFLREKTYYPQLCVMQLAAPDDGPAIAVDVLSEDLNLSPLEPLMFNKDMVKVFHAARQDLEILMNLFDGRLPSPLFDTQIAAMVCGFGDQIGYQALVKNICDADIDKSNQYTNWAIRPLSDSQIEYAISDVTYLRDIYKHLKDLLKKDGREGWIAEEVETLHDPETHYTKPEETWRKIKIRSDKPKTLMVLKTLSSWREKEAQQKDRPRHFILRDEVISELARQSPKKEKDLVKIRGLPEKFKTGKYAALLLDLIASALKVPKDQWPKKSQKRSLAPELAPALEMLKMLLKIQASEYNVVTRLIAAQDDLEELLITKDKTSPIMKGWRYDVFGKHAESLLKGDLSLTLQDQKIKLITRS